MRSLPLREIAKLFNCEIGSSLVTPKGYCTDSRLLKPGDLYFALEGERVDGHAFVREVSQNGAIGAVVSKNFEATIGEFPLLRVENPLVALQKLAKYCLKGSNSRVVAITGSLGKTTTKEFSTLLLSRKYRVAASPGNSNSQVGLPLAILNHSTGDEEILVLEMGMTLPGQIARLVEIAPPDVAVITRVALVHACNFGSIEEIAKAKGEIFSSAKTRLGIMDREMSGFEKIYLTGNFPKISFSIESDDGDYGIDSNGSFLICHSENIKMPLKNFPVPGKHNLHNLLAAVAIARAFHVDWELIHDTLPQLALPGLRLQFIRQRGILFVNDSYNAAEASVKAALASLPVPEQNGRKIAVLGGMLELGKFSHKCHTEVGEFALKHVEKVYCLGEESRPIFETWERAGRPAAFFSDFVDLAACLKKELKTFDVVLLKGSRKLELWKLLEEMKLEEER